MMAIFIVMGSQADLPRWPDETGGGIILQGPLYGFQLLSVKWKVIINLISSCKNKERKENSHFFLDWIAKQELRPCPFELKKDDIW